MFCHKCGAQISEGAMFCHKCGTKVVYTEAAPQLMDTPEDTPEPGSSAVAATTGTKLQATSLVENDQQVTSQNGQVEMPSAGTEDAPETFDVTLCAFESEKKIRVIKVVRTWTGLGLREAKELVEKAPAVLKVAVTRKDAEFIKRVLTNAGATVSFTNQKGEPEDIRIHCPKCGAELGDGNASCTVCGCTLDLPPEYAETPVADAHKLPDGLSMGMILEYFKEMPTIGKVLALLGIAFCVLVLIVVLRLILSSAVSAIVTFAAGYFIYQYWGANYITQWIYDSKGHDLQLPDGMEAQGLIEALSGKFNYPYFKGARYGAEGECLIEGRYAVYPVKFGSGNNAELCCKIEGKSEKRRTILREGIAIRSYINKFFNPTLPFDAAKDLKALKSTEIQRKSVVFVEVFATVLIGVIIGIEYAFPGGIQRITQPGAEVRNAYLTQYSDEITIEEAFTDFFANEKWSTYKDKGYTYVVFTGTCEYGGEPADARITFKITGENFRADTLEINGEEQNDLMLNLLLLKVYADY